MSHRHLATRLAFLCFLTCAIATSALAGEESVHHLSPLATVPDWSELDRFQDTITREEFERLLHDVYAPNGAWQPFITLAADSAVVLTHGATGQFVLRFAPDASSSKPVPRYWQPASSLQPAGKPLAGVKVALDPGHIGGRWSIMEERWFRIGENTKPVTEGDMTLVVAKLLAPELRKLGAEVSFVRGTTDPITARRPGDLRSRAIDELNKRAASDVPKNTGDTPPALPEEWIKRHSELLFYRTAEIRHRAQYVNRTLKPDVVLCIHFNAEAWGDPLHPTFVERNHLHLLINGCYDAAELAYEDVRFDMLMKLLTRTFREELEASETVANYLAGATRLVPYEYTRGNARRIGDNPYIWARNLLANRLYRCPVIYLEPYVMNHQEVWQRVQLGDYEGEREINGVMRKSIYREYADAVAEGLAAHYREARPRVPES